MSGLILKGVRAVMPGCAAVRDVKLENGRITAIAPEIPASGSDAVKDCKGAVLMPGFIDTHIHGGCQKAFFHEDAELSAIAKSYAKRGTTALLPTYSAMPFEQFEAGVGRMVKFAGTPHEGAKIAGIHAEGPYLNAVRKGGMNADYIVKPDLMHFKALEAACGGMLKLITLAPEIPGSLAIIEAARECGAAVSAGHTDATFDEMKRAIDAGLTRMTHTFNAARPLSHREPGVLMAALNDARVNCEVICDFGHLHPATVELIWKMKGSANFTAVSDYSDKRGLAAKCDGSYTTPEGAPYTIWHGVAWNAAGNVMSNGNDLYVGVKNLYSLGIPLWEIAEMACANPAKAAGIFADTGSISVGKAADLVLLDENMEILSVYVDGKLQ